MPEANYCGNCSFPILEDSDESAVRQRARHDYDGFLDKFDTKTILDHLDGEQPAPAEPYQWYLEEAVYRIFHDLALLQQWGWFDKEPISSHFIRKELLDDEPSNEALGLLLVWIQVMAFLYEASPTRLLEFSISVAVIFVEEVDSLDDVEVSISFEGREGTDSETKGPAS